MNRDQRPGAGRPAVVVTGIGAVSAAGLGADALWAAVTAGRPLTAPVTRLDLSRYPARRGAEVPPDALVGLDELVPGHDSLAARYLAAAAVEALRDAGLSPTDPAPAAPTPTGGRSRLGVFAGTVLATRPLLDRGVTPGLLRVSGPGWARSNDLLTPLRQLVTIDGPAVLLAPGCAAGNSAIAAGCRSLAAGEVDVALCGGTAELSLEVFAMFTALRALAVDAVRPFDAERRGTMPGEGAGVLVLERAERAAARGRRPRARVLACAGAADAYHPTHPHPRGNGLISTVRACLTRAGISPEQIDWVSAHGTGTPASDGIEARALTRALPGPRRPVVSALKGQLGHADGAAAALEAVVAVHALAANFVPGNVTLGVPDPACHGVDLVEPAGRHTRVEIVLSPAFGFGGAVSTVLLGAGDDRVH